MMEFLLSQPVTALVSSDKYFLFNSQVPNSVAFLWGTQFRLDRDSGLIRCSKVCPIQLKKKMGLKHPQAHALLALSGNHILTLSEIQAIVDSKYLKVNLRCIRGYVISRRKKDVVLEVFRGFPFRMILSSV